MPKIGKIGFPMPTAKTRFHILGLYLKNIIIEKKTLFLDVLYRTFTLPTHSRGAHRKFF